MVLSHTASLKTLSEGSWLIEMQKCAHLWAHTQHKSVEERDGEQTEPRTHCLEKRQARGGGKGHLQLCPASQVGQRSGFDKCREFRVQTFRKHDNVWQLSLGND